MRTAATVFARCPPFALKPSWKIRIAPGRALANARRAIQDGGGCITSKAWQNSPETGDRPFRYSTAGRVGVRISHGGLYSAGALPITVVMVFCAAVVSAR